MDLEIRWLSTMKILFENVQPKCSFCQGQWSSYQFSHFLYSFCPSLTEEKVEGEINEPVEADKTDVRQECYSLPAQFMWDTLDVHNPSVVGAILYIVAFN